jgi:tungstate transport system ATP-binding protein
MTASPQIAAEITDLRLVRSAEFSLHVPAFSLPAGQVHGLLGPTGSGKTTLLSLLAGVLPAPAGQVQLFGQRLAGKATPVSLCRRVTLVFQRPRMLSGTVRRNVELGLALQRVPPVEAADRVNTLLERLHLVPLAQRAATTLSGGETQLVAIARALVLRPSLLLLDEPTAGLDPRRVALVERVVTEAAAEHGLTVLWASHNFLQMRRVAQSASLMLDGQVVETAPTELLFERPSDPRTADYLSGRYIC